MRRGRPKPKLAVTVEENNRLLQWTRRRDSTAAARYSADAGQVAQPVYQPSPGWSAGRGASGAPRQIGDELVEAVIAKTLHDKPSGATHWSTRRMARVQGLSHVSHHSRATASNVFVAVLPGVAR
jgi:hypothetical protein